MQRNAKPRYSSAIKSMPYLFLEMRKSAKLVADGAAIDSIIQLSMKENIFQLDKEKRFGEMGRKIALRLSALNDAQITALAISPEETSKLVAFYALLKTDLLFFEFMTDVYAGKRSIGQTNISDADIIAFLHSKEEIAKWTDNNFVRVKNTYKAILCEAGLSVREGSSLKIQNPIVNDSLKAAFPVHDEYTAVIGVWV